MRVHPVVFRRSPLGQLALLATLGLASIAQAQDDSNPRAQDDSYLALELRLGVGGEADWEVDVAGFDGSFETDLEASFGAGVAWMSPLHRYFVLGAELGVLSWKPDNADDRNVLLDLALVPQGRLPVSDEVELTLSVPVGLVVDFWGGDEFSAMAGGVSASADVSPGFGFEIGFLLGVRYAVSTDVGLLARLGYVMQSFSHEVEGQAAGVGGSVDVNPSLGQPRIQLGVSF